MSSEIDTKKQRRPNFTSEDLNVLADAVASNKAHLFGKFTNTITANTNSKSSIWEKIINQTNATPRHTALRSFTVEAIYF